MVLMGMVIMVRIDTVRLAIFYVCGLWALGIGFRMSLELVKNSAFLVEGILYFDWLPLMVLGFLSVGCAGAELFERVKKDEG